jgi:glycosyltransferase involved in cell wall biosynthesis
VRQESRLPIARLALAAPAPGFPAPHEGASPWRLVVFGHLGPNRGVDSILDALHLLEERGFFRLHIYGALYDPGLVRQHIEQLGLQDLVTIHGRVSEAELEAALDGAHLAINLRYPTRGEASAAQLRIWSHGIPSIVTKIGWYAEQPANTVAFVRPGHMAEDLAALLRNYRAAPGPFIELGLNGYRHLAECHTPERYVDGLLELAARVGAER